jgi:hypothetical protein
VTRVAKRIIELARKGECDPVRLRDQTIQSFRQSMKDPSTRQGHEMGG